MRGRSKVSRRHEDIVNVGITIETDAVPTVSVVKKERKKKRDNNDATNNGALLLRE